MDGYECTVLTTSPTQITCQIEERPQSPEPTETGQVIVFLATSEEAPSFSLGPICDLTPFVDLTWTWLTPQCSVTDIQTAYDANLEAYVVTVTGSGWTAGDLDSVSLFIDGEEQEPYQVIDEFTAQFLITSMASSTSTDIVVTCGDGNADIQVTDPTITITPVIFEIVPVNAIPDFDSGTADLNLLFSSNLYDSSAGGDCYRIRGIFAPDSTLELIHVLSTN